MTVCRPLIKLNTMIKCKGKNVKTCQCEYRFECIWEIVVTEMFLLTQTFYTGAEGD